MKTLFININNNLPNDNLHYNRSMSVVGLSKGYCFRFPEIIPRG